MATSIKVTTNPYAPAGFIGPVQTPTVKPAASFVGPSLPIKVAPPTVQPQVNVAAPQTPPRINVPRIQTPVPAATPPRVTVSDVAKELPGALGQTAKDLAIGIAKPFLRLGATANALSTSKAFNPNNPGVNMAPQNVPGVGPVKPIKNARDAAGVGLELASYAVGGGEGKAITEQLAKDAFKAALKRGVLSGAGAGAVAGFGSSLQGEQFSARDSLKQTALGAAGGAVLGGAFSGAGKVVRETQNMQQAFEAELVARGMGKAEARQMATEGGFLNFKSAKVQELQTKWQELQQAKLKATSRAAEKNITKAQQAIEDQIWKERQGGFIRLRTEPEPLKTPQQGPGDNPAPLGSPKKVLEDTASYTPKVADNQINYNTKHLNISPEAKTALDTEIQGFTETVNQTMGSKLSNKEAVALADETSKVLNKTVTRAQTEQSIAQTLKLRREIAKAAEGKIDGKFVDLWIKDKAIGTDIARQLQARKIDASPSEVKAIDAVLEGIYKVYKNADEIKKAAEGVNFDDPKQVAEFYRTFVKPKVSDWVDVLRYNSMLSSPNTHINNAVSNFQGTALLTPVEKTITGALDATRAALTGGERKYAIGEGAAYAKGYFSSLKTAATRFTDSLKGNISNANPDTRSIPLATKGIGKAVEKTLSAPVRLLEASDQFFTALTEGGVENSLKYRARQGIGSKVSAGAASEEAAYRLFRADTSNVKQGPVLNAIDFLTNKISEAKQHDNAVVSTIAKFTLPFVRTPMNIFKQGLEYSPLGLSTLPGAANKTEQLAKVIIGTSTALGVATLAGSDRLTWAEPTDEQGKAAFRASGRQAYAIKLGNKWVGYSKLHPALAFNFALVAAIDNGLKTKKLDESKAEAILSSFAKYGNFLADQSYMKNIGDFVSATKGDVGGWTRYISNYPQQLIPFRALMGWVERLTDPVQRQADKDGSLLNKQMQQIMTQIPGLAEKLPVRTNNGEPIPNNNRVVNALSPFRITSGSAAGEQNYQDTQKLKKLGEQSQLESDQSTTRAEEIYNQIKDLSPERRKEYVTDLVQRKEIDKAVVDKYKAVVADHKAGLNDFERKLKRSSVDAKVTFLYDKMQSMSKDERSAYRKDLREKGILTDTVDSQLRKRFTSN